jgi:hypothetical protein
MNTLTASQQEIAVRAYQLYLDSGCQHGQDLNHWFQAEQEIGAKFFTPPAVKSAGKASNSKSAEPKAGESKPAPPMSAEAKATDAKAPAKTAPAKKVVAKKAPAKKSGKK